MLKKTADGGYFEHMMIEKMTSVYTVLQKNSLPSCLRYNFFDLKSILILFG